MTDIHYIAGPPGTGKTTTLVRQVQRAVEARGPNAIAIASMTRTAATHIADRAAASLQERDQLPEHAVGTLHAHAYRALDQPALAETTDGLADWNREHPSHRLRPAGVDDTLDDETQPGAQALHAQVMAHRARQTPETAWTTAQRDHWSRWQDYKHQTGRLDFTDLIQHARSTVHPAMPSVWLLDEAQDLSPLELDLALHWIRQGDIGVLVADQDQTLYGWRGADPRALSAIPYATRRVLGQSYRVPATVRDAALRWIRRCSHRDDVAYQPTATPGSVTRSRITLQAPDQIAELAANTSDEDTVMVLATCRHMLAGTCRELLRAGVPFHNPYRPSVPEWNPLRAAQPLRAYLSVHQPQEPDWTWGDLLDWTEPLDARKALPHGTKTRIEQRCTRDRFGETQTHEHPTLQDLATLLDSPNLDHPALRGDLDWWTRNLRPQRRRQLEPALRLVHQHGYQVLTRRPRIEIGTVHSVKGGEATTVILAPDLSPRAWRTSWSYGARSPQRDPLLRVGYVALTRAARNVILLDPAGPEHLPLREVIA